MSQPGSFWGVPTFLPTPGLSLKGGDLTTSTWLPLCLLLTLSLLVLIHVVETVVGTSLCYVCSVSTYIAIKKKNKVITMY